MNGNFERGETTYPYAYMRAGESEQGPLYRITDMRTLAPVIPDAVSLDAAAWVAAKMNDLRRTAPENSLGAWAVRARELLGRFQTPTTAQGG